MARMVSRRKIVREGALGGLFAGASFAAGQILVSAAAGLEPGAPWELFASVAMGREALEGPLGVGIFVLGAVVHFGLAALFGAVFGLIVAAIRRPVRNNLVVELSGGALYGAVLWLVNFQVIGRILYPWFLDFHPAVQLLVHALFYGVPMATWLALRIRDVEVPGVHEARHRYQTATGEDAAYRLARWEASHLRDEEELPAGRRVPPGPEERPPGGPTIH